ncbi:MAG TPA: FtsX-like permease family protein [Armatimonadota bacterium]
MNWSRLLVRSLVFHWRTGLVALLGLTLATAVITGSLLLGDSVRGSLRDTALARLGNIDYALTSPRPFRAQLAFALAKDRDLARFTPRVAALTTVTGAARSATSGAVVPAVAVQGVSAEFWGLYPGESGAALSGRQAALNQALAQDLGLRIGDTLLVTVARAGTAPLDTLFGRRRLEDTTRTLRLQVATILPDTGAGAFRLDSAPKLPRNVFVDRNWLAQQLGQAGLANTLLLQVAGHQVYVGRLTAALARSCTLTDYDLKLLAKPASGYLSLQTPALALPSGVVTTAQTVAQRLGLKATASSVYLATRLRPVAAAGAPPRLLAYSVAASAASGAGFTFRAGGSAQGPGDGLWLNAWAAEDLGAQLGQTFEIEYLAPTGAGDYAKRVLRRKLTGIVEMKGLGADPATPPDFEGISNAVRIEDWKPPFPVDLGLVTARDDQYWAAYRAAPKLFLSPDTLRTMWQSGANPTSDWITSVQMPVAPGAQPQATARLRERLLTTLQPADAGLVFRPARELALQAAAGTTDFSSLMLSMSMFLILAGAGLAAMLLRLTAQRRAAELGLLLAVGATEKQTTRMIVAEGALLALVSAAVGVPLGVAYAALLIAGLTGWWSGAIPATSLWLHVRSVSLLSGGLAGLEVGVLSSAWAARGLRKRGVLELLGGWQALAALPRPARASRKTVAALVLCLLGALGLIGWTQATGNSAGASPTAFLGSGLLLLVAGLLATDLVLSGRGRRAPVESLARLAWRGAGTQRGRSLLITGLLAAAAFLLIAVAANTRDLTNFDPSRRDSGTGGFALLAISSVPLPYDPGTPVGRQRLGFPPSDEALFAGVRVYSLRVSPGEDISCLNLARATAPQLLGVTPEFIGRGGFRVLTAKPAANPWPLLTGTGAEIPAFGDADSVRWSLHSNLGQTYPVRDEQGESAPLRLVGLLPQSIFAGYLLVSENNFRRLYPSVQAPRLFLIEAPPNQAAAVAQSLRTNLGDLGLTVQDTRQTLAGYLQVQNTYLAMFLALGGLGMILGTLGLVAVLLRSVLERRAELALMLACGFRRGQLVQLLLREHGALVVVGLLLGTAAALVAVAPQLAAGEAQVNWPALGALLLAMAAVGLGAGALAAASSVRRDLLSALREE